MKPYILFPSAWGWWRRQMYYARIGWIDLVWMERGASPPPAWWLCPQRAPDSDRYVFITSRIWWRWLRWMPYRAAWGVGLLDVADGCPYVEGRWRWDIWRAGRPWGA